MKPKQTPRFLVTETPF